MENSMSQVRILAAAVAIGCCFFAFNSCDKDTIENDLLYEKGIIISKSQSGCEFLIRLENNTLLEPVQVDDPFFVLNVGMQVEVSYLLPGNLAGACNDAVPAHIKKISNSGCNIAEFWPAVTGFASDPLHKLESLFVDGDALYFTGELIGGCVNHAFRLVRDGTCCDTSLTQPWEFYLFHNARNDQCSAKFSVQHCWNLTNLQLPDVDSVKFFVNYTLPDGPRKRFFTYHY
jgi:hypothetical protein